jgi:hypothetical protein
MTETALGLVKADPSKFHRSSPISALKRTKRYFEFFTVPIRNKNTRIAYYHAIGQFLDWSQRADFRIWRILSRSRWRHTSNTTRVRRQLLSSMYPPSGCSFLADRERDFGHESCPAGQDGEVFSQRGKTPALETDQVQKVLDKIETSNEVGLRDLYQLQAAHIHLRRRGVRQDFAGHGVSGARSPSAMSRASSWLHQSKALGARHYRRSWCNGKVKIRLNHGLG